MYIKTNGTTNNLASAPDFYFHDAEDAVKFIKALVKSGRHMFIDVKLCDNAGQINYITQELQEVISANNMCDFRFRISI